MLVAVYVDDLMVTGSSIDEVKKFKDDMANRFEMSDLGQLTHYLGIEVLQGKEGIVISQKGYAEKILVEAGMSSSNPARTPMETSLKLSAANNEEDIDATSYRKVIGCLKYLTHTRPDTSFAVGVLSRYMQRPKESHGAALKRVLRYICGTKEMGLFYRKGNKRIQYTKSTSRLSGYSDSSHNIDPDDGKSTTGHLFYLERSLITWCSQKQETVALSSCEAEFMAATEASKQGLWQQDMFNETVGVEHKKILIQVDNKSALALMKNPVFHGRSKHIHTRYHFIRECVEDEKVEVVYIPGKDQLADILTKPLGRNKFQELRSRMGVRDVSNMWIIKEKTKGSNAACTSETNIDEIKGEIVNLSSSILVAKRSKPNVGPRKPKPDKNHA